jgi:hypothetical protein
MDDQLKQYLMSLGSPSTFSEADIANSVGGNVAPSPMPVTAAAAPAQVQLAPQLPMRMPSSQPAQSVASIPDFGPPTMDKQNQDFGAPTLDKMNPGTPSVRDYLMQKYGLDDGSALKAAQSQSANQRFYAQLGAAGNTIGSAIGHVKADNSFFDNMIQSSNQPVADLQAQNALKMQGLTNSQQIEATAQKQEMDDPNSSQSKVIQATIAKLYPGKFSAEDLASVPASMSDTILKPVELESKIQEARDNHQMRIEMMRQGADAKASAANDKEMNQTQILLEQMRGSPAVAQAEKDIYASQKLNSLIGKGNLSPQQVQLAATEMAKMASGGTPSIHELQGLIPSTLPSGLAALAQKVMNKPVGADADAFVKQMQDYSNSIAKDAQQIVKDRYGRILEPRQRQLGETNYGNLTQRYTNRFDTTNPTQTSKIKVSNGKETLLVDPADLAHATADGYKQVN